MSIHNKFSLVVLYLLSLSLGSCGTEKIDQRQPEVSSEDLVGKASAVIAIQLPAINTLLPNEQKDGQVLPNAAFIGAKAKDETCDDDASWETLLTYPEQLSVSIPTKGGCDYTVDVRLGYIGELPPLKTSVTFDSPIKSLLMENCASCHDGFDAYVTVKEQAEAIVYQVSNKLMPPPKSGGLSEENIALFLAWQAAEYPEKIEAVKEDEGSLAANLSEVYYRNKANINLSASYLSGLKKHVYIDLLWLQEAGKGRGFQKASVSLEKIKPDNT